MRTQTLELSETLTAFAAGGRSVLSPGLPTDFPLVALYIHVRGRYRVTAVGTARRVEAPRNVIERLRIFGNHRRRGHIEVLNLEGVDLHSYANFYGGVSPQSEDGGLSFQVGEYDFEVMYPVYFFLELTEPGATVNTILDAPAFNSLQLEITWAALTDFVAGGTTSFTDFNLTTGNPTITIHREVPLLGEAAVDFDPRIVLRSFESIAQSSVALTDGLLTDRIPTGNLLRSIMLKVGTRAAGSGFWTTVDDTILTRAYVKIGDQKTIRRYRWEALKQINKHEFRMPAVPDGYAMIDFVKDGDVRDALVTADFDLRNKVLKLNVDLTSTADARINAIYTQILLDR